MFRPLALVVLEAILFARNVSAQDDSLLSEGTCYYDSGRRADSRYIPCGNDALGHITCCESGDVCLSNNACFNGQFYVTYLAGCTDSTYEDESCPYKGVLADQQWVGLAYCGDTSDDWVLCDNSEQNSNTVTSALPCSCPTTSTFAFSAISTLVNEFRLPASTGASMCSMSGAVCVSATASLPSTSSIAAVSSSSSTTTSASSSETISSTTVTSSASSTTRTASTSAPTSATPSQTSLPTSTSPASGMSTGAKAGIGAGVAIGCCLLLALSGCIYIRRRKQRQLAEEDASIRPRSGAITVAKDPSKELNQRSPAWSGNMSEMGGADRGSGSLVSPLSSQGVWTRPTSAEVEGSVPSYQSMGDLRAQALGGIGPTYRPYRKEEVPPIGVHEVNGESVAPREVRKAEGRPGSGVFEIPAQVPGSTLPY